MRIEYEDQEILVIYKEAGLPVQTGRISQKDVVSLLKNHLAKASGEGLKEGAVPYLGIVHRLDQPVEGLLVFAKTPKSAAALSAQAAAKNDMEKVYQALVSLDQTSYPLAIEGRKRDVMLVDWIGRDTSSNTSYICSEGERGAKRAELVFRTLKIKDSTALLQISLHTGRHHQIRVQMANAGMPLIGDRKYGEMESSGNWRSGEKEGPERLKSGKMQGSGIWNSTDRIEYGMSRRGLCLCASHLSFVHPSLKKKMEFDVAPSFLEGIGGI